jgi:hypothetical protein
MLLESLEYVDVVVPVLRRISGAMSEILEVVLDTLQKRGSAGIGIVRCEYKGRGLSVGLHMNNPAVEYSTSSSCFLSNSSEEDDSASLDEAVDIFKSLSK